MWFFSSALTPGSTFMMSCFTNNNRKARKERISFWFGLGPSENITGIKQELRRRPEPSAGEENGFHHIDLNQHHTETRLEKQGPAQDFAHAVCLCILTEALGHDSAAVLRVHNPVVVLQSVHDLQYSAHPADGVVDCHCADELRGQVRVQGQLDLRKDAAGLPQ